MGSGCTGPSCAGSGSACGPGECTAVCGVREAREAGAETTRQGLLERPSEEPVMTQIAQFRDQPVRLWTGHLSV